ncbi:unnamed protein product [Urochloa decumbens]|uniref:BTB domain-containing protein n=1 Tax=Urochloa decumbens TaxID=240449 RepID=A0ABC8WEB7_9POAL
MNHSCTKLTEGVQSVLLLKIDGRVTEDTVGKYRARNIIKSRCSVDGFDWEICFHPAGPYGYLDVRQDASYLLALELVFLGGAARPAGSATANLSGKILDGSSYYFISPYHKMQKNVPKEFNRPLDQSPPFYIGVGTRYGCDFRLTVECTLTVFRETAQESIPVPLPNLSWQLGELLCSQARADVEFSVSGKSFAAHRSVLAARCPNFMEFFGTKMKEKDDAQQLVEIQDMDPAVFKSMLHFIYTDAVPEFGEMPDAAPAVTDLAEHLIVAADKYGLDRLRVMCERRLALGISVNTVASMLALAEKQSCSLLKTKCIEFITEGSQENLKAVVATEGYKELVGKSPLLLNELLVAAHGTKRSRSGC